MNRDKLKQLQEVRAALDKILEIKPAKYPAINFIKSWKDEVQAEIDQLHAEEESIWDRFKVRDQVRLGTMQGWVHTIEDKGSKDNFGVQYVVTVQFPSGTMTFNDYTLHHLEKVNQFPDDDSLSTRARNIVMRWQGTSADLDKNAVARYVNNLERDIRLARETALSRSQNNSRWADRAEEAEARVKELEKELESRPRVWCVRNDRGEILKQSAYDRMAQTMYHFDGLFPSRELASRLFTGETEPYRGEEQ